MGGSESKSKQQLRHPVPRTVTLTKPLTETPWRRVEYSDWNCKFEDSLTEDIRKINPPEKPNILISGPVGAGKSSFINAVFSIGEGRKVSKAQTGSSTSSFTVQYTGYTQKTLLKQFILRDTMGIEPGDGAGFHVDDFIHLVRGQIENKYRFNPANPISPGDNRFRENPLPGDKIHCVIFVISSVDIYDGIPKAYITKIRQLQDKLRPEGIPRVLLLTKADLLCDQVQENISLMFRSVKIQQAVKTASEIFSIDQASIHPVVNYEVDNILSAKHSIPILLALRQSMYYALDRVEQDRDDEKIR